MRVHELGMGVLELVPQKFGDERGFFAETFQADRFAEAGLPADWTQDNQSRSSQAGVLRGLHLQLEPHAQDKLIRVLRGSIFDVAVDVRPGSPTFGKWVACIVSAESFNQLFVPRGFAHGFLTLEEGVEVLYKVNRPYAPASERCIRWDDPSLAIDWPLDLGVVPQLSQKDAQAPTLAEVFGHRARQEIFA
jgi:dTDP-4-dehydrorhamnose 3,5-epimerase